MHNPLRSEEEAFRWAVTIAAGAAAVIALTLLTDAVFGVVLMAALIGIGGGVLWTQSRGREPRKAEIARGGGGGVHRILVIANQTVGGRALLEEIVNRAKGKETEIRVVCPALPSSQLKHWASDVDEAIEQAKRRLQESVAAIRQSGLAAYGEVGDSDPNVAIEDSLGSFPADEVIVSTHPPGRSHWLDRGVVERAREEVDLPVTHVIVDIQQERQAQRGAA